MSQASRAKRERPAALIIAPLLPSESGNGLAMRTGFFLNTYAKRFAIDLAVVPIAGPPAELTPFIDARVHRVSLLPLGAAESRFALIERLASPEARLAAFRRYARPSFTARLGTEVRRALMTFAGDVRYELVHVSRLYLANLAAAWTKTRGRSHFLVLDCDEDDISAYRRLARLHLNWGHNRQANWANAEADAFKAMAKVWLPRFDLVLAASATETRSLETHVEGVVATVVPNVVPANAVKPVPRRVRNGRRNIVFVGNMRYLPNIDAAMWFVLRIWPKLRSAVPFPVRLIISGPNPPHGLMKLARQAGIVVTGAVEDLGSLYREAALAVVPIRAGGGTRIKVLESAGYGVPIVATRFGAAGTGLRSEYELLLADREQEFALCCARLLTDDRLASRLADQARRRVHRNNSARYCGARLLSMIDAGRSTGTKARIRWAKQ